MPTQFGDVDTDCDKGLTHRHIPLGGYLPPGKYEGSTAVVFRANQSNIIPVPDFEGGHSALLKSLVERNAGNVAAVSKRCAKYFKTVLYSTPTKSGPKQQCRADDTERLKRGK